MGDQYKQNMKLRALRRWTEMTMEEFCEEYDLSYDDLWRWEHDITNPPRWLVERVEREVERDFPDD